MKRKLKVLALLTCLAANSFADDSFSWNGYFKAGLGMDTSLANVDRRDEEVHSLGRFGLEYDNFSAANFSKKWTNNRGQWAKYNYSLVLFDDYPTSPLGINNFAEMGGLDFLPKDSSIWVGRKKDSSGVDLLDFDYRNFSGNGIGYSSKNTNISFFKEVNVYDLGEFDDVATLDLIHRINNFTFELTTTKVTEDTNDPYPNDTIKGDSSYSFLASYNQNKFLGISEGNTTYRVQLGKGVTSNKLNMGVVTDKEDTGLRTTVEGMKMTKDWLYNVAVNFESTKDYSKDLTYSTTTLAGRGTNKITDNLSMIYEAGIANKTNVDLSGNASKDADGVTYKVAAGPAIQIDSNPFVRPVIRFSGAVIGGDKEVTNFDKDYEVRLGAQFETWF